MSPMFCLEAARMIPAEELERTHFHDASLARCFSNGDALHLHFNNIAYEM